MGLGFKSDLEETIACLTKGTHVNTRVTKDGCRISAANAEIAPPFISEKGVL